MYRGSRVTIGFSTPSCWWTKVAKEQKALVSTFGYFKFIFRFTSKVAECDPKSS
jgi:hypothetical protein